MMADGHNIHVPDPSSLTTAQLHRELMGLQLLIGARLDGMDRAAELLAANFARVPSDTDKQIDHLRGLHEEKFVGVQRQFRERDMRAMASETASGTAVNAALLAQKEAAAAQNAANSAAITKSEAATADQIKGILLQMHSNTKATDDKIAEINHRLDRGEGAGSGRASTQATTLAVAALAVSMVVGGYGIYRSASASESALALAPAPAAVATPGVGLDSKRIDDLVARMNSMSQRIDSQGQAQPK